MYDFHMHSIYSDGAFDELEILKVVKENGVKYFSLTDHDTIQGSKRILNHRKFLEENNIKFIIGSELSTSINGHKTHLLAYDFNYSDSNMLKLLDMLKNNKWKETMYRIENLKELFDITLSDDSITYLQSRYSVTKPNIAECMKNEGYVETKGEAIREYINKIPKKDFYLSSKTAIDLVHAAKGKVFLAHPFGESSDELFNIDNVEPYIKILVEAGIDGIECYYSAYSKDRIEFLLRIAEKYNLLVSAGSDCHGHPTKYGRIGQVSADNTEVKAELLTVLNLIK